MEVKKNIMNSINQILLLITNLFFLAGLTAYAYMGSFMRAIGDDYCYGGLLNRYGFFGSQIYSYMNHVPFHGDRYTLTFFSIFFSLFPPIINSIIPALTLVLFSIANYFLIQSVRDNLRIIFSKLIMLLMSLAIVFFTLLFSPSVNQSLYTRSAMLTTLAPIIGTIILVSLVIKYNIKKPSIIFILLFLSVINSGFSENGASFQAAVGLIVLLFGLFTSNKRIYNKKSITILSGTMIIGSLIGVLIMWLSPSIGTMTEDISPNFIYSFLLSLQHSFDFYFGFLQSFINGFIILVLFGCFMFIIIIKNRDILKKFNKTNLVNWLLLLLLSQLTSLFMIFSIMFPSAMIRNVYPDPRHLIGAVVPLIFNFIITGIGLAAIMINLIQKTFTSINLSKHYNYYNYISLFILIFFSFLYPIRYIPHITADNQLFKYWSFQWDKRHELILELANSGEQSISVMQLDHIIEGIGELGPVHERNWYNLCAAEFYNINAINADQPGWEEGLREFMNLY